MDTTTLATVPLTPIQAAERIGCHYLTVLREIQRGRLAAFKVGRNYRITEAAIRQYMGHPAGVE